MGSVQLPPGAIATVKANARSKVEDNRYRTHDNTGLSRREQVVEPLSNDEI